MQCVDHDGDTHPHLMNKGLGLETLIVSQDVARVRYILIYTRGGIIQIL